MTRIATGADSQAVDARQSEAGKLLVTTKALTRLTLLGGRLPLPRSHRRDTQPESRMQVTSVITRSLARLSCRQLRSFLAFPVSPSAPPSIRSLDGMRLKGGSSSASSGLSQSLAAGESGCMLARVAGVDGSSDREKGRQDERGCERQEVLCRTSGARASEAAHQARRARVSVCACVSA